MGAAALLVGALLAAVAARRLGAGERCDTPAALRRTRDAERLWWIAAALLLLLSVERAIGLDMAATAAGRHLAEMSGLYPERRAIQRPALAGTAAVAVGAAVALLAGHRRAGVEAWAALLAALGLAVMRVVGMVSLHGTDALFGARVGPVSLGAALQGLLLAVVAAAALAALGRAGKLWMKGAGGDAGASAG